MKIFPQFRNIALALIVVLFCLTGCGGGGSSQGSLGINGSLGGGTTGTGGTGRAESESLTIAPEDFSGIEVCCGGQCDVTGANGEFQLFTNPESELLCTLHGGTFSNDFFIIMNIPSGATSIDVRVTIIGGQVVMTEITSSTVPGAESTPTPEDTGSSDDAGDGSSDTGTASCGNGVVEEGEVCDGVDLAGSSCSGLGVGDGDLTCLADCSGFDESACGASTSPVCGDGVVDSGETCDGGDLGGMSCSALGYDAGSLSCNSSCELDMSGCEMSESCSEPVCPTTSAPPTCLSCACDDGFAIGDCSAICFDTMSVPTTCTGGVGCPDGSEPGCP